MFSFICPSYWLQLGWVFIFLKGTCLAWTISCHLTILLLSPIFSCLLPPCTSFLCSPWLPSSILNSFHAESKDFNFLLNLNSTAPKHDISFPCCLLTWWDPSYSMASAARARSSLTVSWSPLSSLPSAPAWPSAWINETGGKLPQEQNKRKFSASLGGSLLSSACGTGLEVAQCSLPDSSERAGLGFRSCLCLDSTRRWMKRCGMYLGAERNLFSQNLYSSVRAAVRLLDGLRIGSLSWQEWLETCLQASYLPMPYPDHNALCWEYSCEDDSD